MTLEMLSDRQMKLVIPSCDHTAKVGRQDRARIEEKENKCMFQYIKDEIGRVPINCGLRGEFALCIRSWTVS